MANLASGGNCEGFGLGEDPQRKDQDCGESSFLELKYMNTIPLLVAGLALLLVGGELIVRGASCIAAKLGMSKLLIGLTVVAFGTSAPELAICLDAVCLGKSEVALGSIVGSNIANVLLILGLTATLFPIVVHRQIVQREVPIMIAVSLLFLLLTLDGVLYPAEGVVLLMAMALFLIWQIRSETTLETSAPKPTNQAGDRLPTGTDTAIWLSVVQVFGGAACLWFGASWMVGAASTLAIQLGVSDLVIGLTIVAVGSSAPEIVVSLLAAKRGFPEMAVGSIIGSNIANLLLVGGITTVLSPGITIPVEAFQFDIPVMLVSSIACLPIFATGHRIDRWEGILFLGWFTVFMVLLFIKPASNQTSPSWGHLVWLFAVPIVLATCLAIVLHKYRKLKN
ncbi:MAG: cation:H+ antiporter [Mariniblastus sp.]|jgi:cation:H+ antiporter